MKKILELLAGGDGRARNTFALAKRAVACLACSLLATPAAIADSVSGAVTDAASTVSFRGAVVNIDGREGSAITDGRGRFRLSNVPAGTYTLVISYVGTTSTRLEITVPPEGLDLGDVVIGDAESEGLVEEVIVYGQAAAFASALNQERAAINAVSVLDTDAMGQFPGSECRRSSAALKRRDRRKRSGGRSLRRHPRNGPRPECDIHQRCARHRGGTATGVAARRHSIGRSRRYRGEQVTHPGHGRRCDRRFHQRQDAKRVQPQGPVCQGESGAIPQ